MAKSTVKECEIEAELVERVEALGGVALKARVIGQRGFFDRLVLLPGARVLFVEVKRPKGGRMSAHQRQYAMRVSTLGLAVAVVRNSADIDALLK
jgi:hypothetical protein